MGAAKLTKKCRGPTHEDNEQKKLYAIVFLQQMIFWGSLSVAGSNIYLLCIGAISSDILPSTILLLVSSGCTLTYIILHTLVACFHTDRTGTVRTKALTGERCAKALLRCSATLWLAACGFALTFVAARQPFCLWSERAIQYSPSFDVGYTCVIQRLGVAMSVWTLLCTLVLFVLVTKSHEPFRCHLFGITKESRLLPLVLPYHSAAAPMFSEMSFKCRSSSSLSSNTLVASRSTSASTLLPTCPEKAHGLGIYAPREKIASLLTPRPSLSSLRSYTTTLSVPPSSPLPPLPAYFPEKYRKSSAMHKAIHPPAGPYPLSRSRSDNTVRTIAPSPALSAENLAAFNKSTESLSSVYSRSISGEMKVLPRPGSLSDRSYSPGSASTTKKSPLAAMRTADAPHVIVIPEPRSRVSSDGSESGIDDVAALQARLPLVSAVSEFGDVEQWKLIPVEQEEGKGAKTASRYHGIASLRVKRTRASVTK